MLESHYAPPPDQSEDALSALALALPPVPPPHALRTRLLAEALPLTPELRSAAARFAGLRDRVARLFDIAEERAQTLLAMLADPSCWVPAGEGIRMMHVPVGASLAQADAGFVRLAPGAVMARHLHLGEEDALVLQGAYRDFDGAVLRAGESRRLPAGTWHDFQALPGEDCVFAAVVHEGIEFPDGSRLK